MALWLTFINELHVLLQNSGIDALQWEIRSIAVCDSTNDYTTRLFKLNTQKSVVLSRVQEKGRGRGENIWESPIGGIWLSIGIRDSMPIIELSGPVVETVNKVLSKYVACTIKEPNDIFVDGKKVCGVLVETKMQGDKMSDVIIGIGINTHNDVPEQVKDIATTLKDHTDIPPVPQLAAEVAEAVILMMYEKELIK